MLTRRMESGDASPRVAIDAVVPTVAGDQSQGTASTMDTPAAAAFNISKVILGAGGFAMPWAFRYTGLVGGPLTVILIAVIGSFVMNDLIRIKQHVQSTLPLSESATATPKRSAQQREYELVSDNEKAPFDSPGTSNGDSTLTTCTYVDAARFCFGNAGAVATYVMSLACSLGVCSAYLVFVSETLSSLMPADVVSQDALMSGTVALVLPITWLKDFTFLSFFARWGVGAVILGYGVTVVYAVGFAPPLAVGTEYRLFGTVPEFVHVFGSIAFLFCVHFLVFPIHSAMSPKEKFPMVQTGVFAGCAALNIAFGVTGYMCFGDDVGSIVLHSLGDGFFLQSVRFLLCIDLVCSYPLVFASGREIVESTLLPQRSAMEHDRAIGSAPTPAVTRFLLVGAAKLGVSGLTAQRCVIRTAMVCVTWLLAQLKNFGTLITLVGGVSQVLLAFVMPIAMTLMLFSKDMTTVHRICSVMTALCGIAIALLTSAAALGLTDGV